MYKVLRLYEMVFRQGTLARRIVHAVISIALRLFFRRIETSGAEKVPEKGALIFVLNHPNGLIDPALVFVALPRPISFLAKSTVFNLPVISFLLRTLETLPLYRRIDAGENVAQNQKTFAACHELLGKGGAIALFPEGISHNETKLLPVKTGAARIALGALSIDRDRDLNLKICPVGLYYTSKTSFRSEALLRFGEPFAVLPVEMDENGQLPRQAVRELSEKIAESLRGVTLNVENAEQLETVRRTEQIFSSVYETVNFRTSLAEELQTRRRFAAQIEDFRRRAPERVEQLTKRIENYERELRRIGIAPEHLSVSAHPLRDVIFRFWLRVAIIAAFAPIVFVGAVLHLPAYLLCLLLARIFRRHGPDESGGTIKILAAILLMPLTWLAISVAAFFLWNWQAGVIAFPLAIVCGYVALRSLEELIAMRGWYKAARVLVRSPNLFVRLLRERRVLYDEITAFDAENGPPRS
ncbi:MAG: lysophospholipid acyltransferase family protein [Acidobacteriota bacterium]|nr:lysophospholipid acyltransferase family protein [Acidobacteriota bacterium]